MPKTPKANLIYQFTVTLHEIEPAIWRRIQVPATHFAFSMD